MFQGKAASGTGRQRAKASMLGRLGLSRIVIEVGNGSVPVDVLEGLERKA